MRARDEGTVEISHQLLVYPVTSMDFTSDSYRDNAEGYLLTTKSMRWFWDHYIGPNGDPNDPYASPLVADDLSGLPNAHVITAEYDWENCHCYRCFLRAWGFVGICVG